MTQHRYSDDEVRAIFTRASDRQVAREEAETAGGQGLTLAELQQIGRQVGIDPEDIADAARALTRDRPGGATTEPENPWLVAHTRAMPGAVSDEAWEQIVGELRRTFRTTGSVSQFGDVREWYSWDQAYPKTIHVRMEASRGETLMTLRQDCASVVRDGFWGGAAGALVTLLGSVAMVVGGIEPWQWVLLSPFAAVALFGLTGGKRWARRQMAKQRTTFRALSDRIELVVRRYAVPPDGGTE